MNTDDDFGDAHRWSGWPGAFCLNCHAEDPHEICLADDDGEGRCICASMGELEGPCRVIPEKCPAPGHYARWFKNSEAIAFGIIQFATWSRT